MPFYSEMLHESRPTTVLKPPPDPNLPPPIEDPMPPEPPIEDPEPDPNVPVAAELGGV